VGTSSGHGLSASLLFAVFTHSVVETISSGSVSEYWVRGSEKKPWWRVEWLVKVQSAKSATSERADGLVDVVHLFGLVRIGSDCLGLVRFGAGVEWTSNRFG